MIAYIMVTMLWLTPSSGTVTLGRGFITLGACELERAEIEAKRPAERTVCLPVEDARPRVVPQPPAQPAPKEKPLPRA